MSTKLWTINEDHEVYINGRNIGQYEHSYSDDSVIHMCFWKEAHIPEYVKYLLSVNEAKRSSIKANDHREEYVMVDMNTDEFFNVSNIDPLYSKR
jgi:hypothetical protein